MPLITMVCQCVGPEQVLRLGLSWFGGDGFGLVIDTYGRACAVYIRMFLSPVLIDDEYLAGSEVFLRSNVERK